MKTKKSLFCLLCALAVTSVPSFSAMAATGTKITSVSIEINSSITAGDDGSQVDATANASRYQIEEVSVTNEPEDGWEDGDKPKVKITLEAGDGYYFPSDFSKSSVTINGSDGTVTSVSRSGSSRLYVNVTLDELYDNTGRDLEVYGLEWNEYDGIASWGDSEDAKRYEVRLYRGTSAVTSALTVYDTSYDFSGKISKSGDYTFKVRAVYSSSSKGSWVESNSWYVSSSLASDFAKSASSSSSSSSSSPSSTSGGPGGDSSATGAWLRDSVGWWYRNADNSFTVSNWQSINSRWYFFNEVGYMKTGWIQWNGKWYYCTENGDMLENTTTPDGYYVGNGGAWVQ